MAVQADSKIKVDLGDIKKAREQIKAVVRRTEMLRSEAMSRQCGNDIWLKLENTQITGSFKLRGAFNKISSLTPEERSRGVVASSAGNHAQGVAFSAAKAGVQCTIVMPMNAPLIKVESTRGFGARVVQHGEIYDDAFDKAKEIERDEGLSFVHPYEDALIIAGQGTIGLEIFEDLPNVETVVVPIGGGGLISGIAVALKALRPEVRVVGVQSELSDNLCRVFRGETPSPEASPASLGPKVATIADGIAVKRPSPRMMESFIRPLVDEIVLVSDDEIAEAIVNLIERQKTVAEGAGAAAVAAVLAGKVKLKGPSVIVVGGGNIDLNIMAKVIEKGLVRKGRLVELSVIVDDLPGNLNRLTQILAANRANILEVHHDRVSRGLELRQTKINFVIETTNHEHVERIREAFRSAGAVVNLETEVKE